jgi:RNA polymerase sigma factor (sigma-70 family)
MSDVFPAATKCNDTQEKAVIEAAQKGSRAAIEMLIKEYQPFVYNVALKLVGNSEDAADISQEALLKVLTKLTQFNFKSSFKTWVYRIVMNHFLNTKRRKSEEERVHSFDELGDICNDLYNEEGMSPAEQLSKNEEIRFIRDKYMASTLLCLNRQQRIVLVLGAVFRINSTEAAQVLDITPENFRKQLQRAKEDLFQFMENKCGLMNPDNPCKCHKKTKGFIKDGLIDPESIRFHREAVQTINAVVGEKNKSLDNLMEGKYLHLFTDQPYANPLEKEALVRQILEDPEIREIYQLS